MRLSSPMLNENTFAPKQWGGMMSDMDRVEASRAARATTMTTTGVVVKTSFCFVLTLAGAAVTWTLGAQSNPLAMPLGIGGTVLGLVLGLVLMFKQNLAPFLAPVYAIAQGLFTGWISQRFNDQWAGIVMNALLITMGCFVGCLVAYASGFVRIGRMAMAVITIGAIGLALAWGGALIGSLAGYPGMAQAMYGGGPIGLIVSGIAIVLAVLSLISAIQFVDEGVKSGAPKKMEWYAAYGLLATLVWLYIEILQLLRKLQSRE